MSGTWSLVQDIRIVFLPLESQTDGWTLFLPTESYNSFKQANWASSALLWPCSDPFDGHGEKMDGGDLWDGHVVIVMQACWSIRDTTDVPTNINY